MSNESKMTPELKAKIADATKKNAEAGNQDVIASLGGSTCINPELTNKFLDLAQKGGDALASIQGAVDPTKAAPDSDLYLKSEYERAKRIRQNADLDFYVAEQNYFVNIKGGDSYKALITDRIKNTGNKEYETILKKFIEMNEIASILITTTDVREVAEENMNKVVHELEKNNDRLRDIINSGTGDAITYQRKSSYESKMKEMVQNWSVIPTIIYWTLLILWVGIVMFYLQQMTLVNFAILIALILYPYLSTNIIVWILGFVQGVWTFIFSAVKNRVSA
jgi:hypothetical protein